MKDSVMTDSNLKVFYRFIVGSISLLCLMLVVCFQCFVVPNSATAAENKKKVSKPNQEQSSSAMSEDSDAVARDNSDQDDGDKQIEQAQERDLSSDDLVAAPAFGE